MRFCPHCGHEITEEMRFCGQCGAPLVSKPSRPGARWWVMGALLVLAGIGLGLLGYFFYPKPVASPPWAKTYGGEGKEETSSIQPPPDTEPVASPPWAKTYGVEPTSEAVVENYMNNAKRIALALLMYAQDYDEYFPPAENAQNLLHPYLKNPTLFTDPRTGQNIFTYLLNGDYLGAIDNPAEKRIGILDWGDPEWIIVMFADGHVKRVPRGQ